MFSSITYYVLIYLTPVILNWKICAAEPPLPPSLALYTPGDLEYTDVLVKRVSDNLTLMCELKGDTAPRMYVWNYVPANGSDANRPFTVEPTGPSPSSKLTKENLQISDSGHYMCSAPPFSVTKYILVQSRGPAQCARGAFWCGSYCVLAAYVCDGFPDCRRGEDEAPSLCAHRPCARPDKLNCSSGRCISEAACCRAGGGAGAAGGGGPLCQQPACCEEHARYSRLDAGYVELDYPPLFEDRHAPDDYGFIQSTIYTVTACALIFMIAVVLLVSAICKMHMKRAALRSYAHAERATRHHYNMQYAQAHRFPPCYEASRLLEQEARGGAASPLHSPPASPDRHNLQCTTECPPEDAGAECVDQNPEECTNSGFGLARLSAIFSSRYRQVPTQCLDVEMTAVRSASLNSSPTRNTPRPRLDNYRSPTYCDLNADLFFNPETANCGPDLNYMATHGRDLNYMATPVEFFRRRTLRGNLERVLDLGRPRPLTLQLGRFQLSIPRLGRRTSLERRPDTPNVAELNIDDLDFVRLNSNETYTLNGRTIRLLGANFENYPVLNDTPVRPPPYTEAMRYKLYGPPPEYLSRDGLNVTVVNNVTNTNNEEQARSNVEMPPCYDELASGVDANANVESNSVNNVGNVAASQNNDNNACNNAVDSRSDVINNVTAESAPNNGNNVSNVVNNGISTSQNTINNASNVISNAVSTSNNGTAAVQNNSNALEAVRNVNNAANVNDNTNSAPNTLSDNNATNFQHTLESTNGNNVTNNLNDLYEITENISSVIDNLPAIDSDVNANETCA